MPAKTVIDNPSAVVVVPPPSTALETLPNFLQADLGKRDGTEGIGQDDMRMPRLAIAQGLSPQMQDTKGEYIEGLKLGHLFNTLTRSVYGKGPLKFAIIRRDPPVWKEFDAERNLVDPDVPYNDPRTLWTKDPVTGKNTRIATQFYDFIAVLLDTMEPLAISCSRSNTGAAKELNGLIMVKQMALPIYAWQYTVEVATKPHEKGGTYGVFVFKNAGVIQHEGQYLMLKQAHEQFKNRVVTIDHEIEPEPESEM